MSQTNGKHPAPVEDAPLVIDSPPSHPPPRRRQNQNQSGAIALVFITLLSIWGVRSCASAPSVTVVNPEPEASPSPSAAAGAAEPQAELPPPIEGALATRNAYFQSAQEQVDAQIDRLICARVVYLWNAAEANTEATGQSRERFLLDQLDGVKTRTVRENRGRDAFTGSPDQQSLIRPALLDTKALLVALKAEYSGEALPNCGATEVKPNSLWQRAEDFLAQAYLAIGIEAQQQQSEETEDATPLP